MNEHIQKVFIVGTPKSGTSFLFYLLADHPNVLPFFETRVYDVNKEGDDIEIKIETRGSGPTQEEVFAKIQEIAERYSGKSIQFAAIQAMIALLCNHNTTHFVEKTPQHFVYIPSILEDFPDAKIVHMLRDPRDNYLSLKRRMDDEGSEKGTEEGYHPLSFIDDRLLISMEFAHKNAQIFPNNYRILYYEDLIYGRGQTVKEVIDWLGLPWHNTLMLPSYNGEYWPGNSGSLSEMHPFDARSIGQWVFELSGREIAFLEGLIKLYELDEKYRLTTNPSRLKMLLGFIFPFERELQREGNLFNYLTGDYIKKRKAIIEFFWKYFNRSDGVMIDDRFVL